MLILANMWVWLWAILFVVVCTFMMLVILIQKPKGGGLSGAFGGAGGGSAQAAFGAKTGDVLTWFTVICFVAFLLLAMGLQWTIQPEQATLQGDPTFESALEEAITEGGPTLPMTDVAGSPEAAADSTDAITPPPETPAEGVQEGDVNFRDAMEAGEANVPQQPRADEPAEDTNALTPSPREEP